MAVRKQILAQHDAPPQLERYEIIDKINALETQNPQRDKALIAFLYLTGCRVEEVVRYILERDLRRRREKKGSSILKKQVEISDDIILIRNVRTLKRRKFIPRTIPIIRIHRDHPFIKMFLEHLESLQEDDEIFPITRQRAYQIVSSVGLYCHYLRHLRLTHLVVDHDFHESHLIKFTGWKDGKAASTYVHLNVTDLIEKMQR